MPHGLVSAKGPVLAKDGSGSSVFVLLHYVPCSLLSGSLA